MREINLRALEKLDTNELRSFLSLIISELGFDEIMSEWLKERARRVK